MIAPIQRIDAWRLRQILQNKLYRAALVEASPLGGWFKARKVTSALHRSKVSTVISSRNVNPKVSG